MFVAHLWLGLILGIYFVVMGLTGSVLAYRHTLDAALDARLRVVPGPRRASLDEVLAAIRESHPDAKPTRVDVPESADWAYVVLTSGKPAQQVLVDPYSSEVRGIRDPEATFVGWVYRLHRNLLFDKPGHTANAYAALAVGWLLVTGLLLWWPKTRGQLRMRLRVASKASLKRRMHDWHNVLGIYSLPILLVVVLTGTTFEFKEPVGKAVYVLTGSPADPKPIKHVTPGASRPWQELLDRAESAAPGRTSFIFLPSKRNPAFRIIRELPGGESLRRRATISVDPGSGEVVRVDGVKPSIGKVIVEAFAPLHFGQWGGAFSTVLQALLGLCPLGLFCTGLYKTVGRQKNRREAGGKPSSNLEAGKPGSPYSGG